MNYWNGSCFAPISLLGVDTKLLQTDFSLIRGQGNYLTISSEVSSTQPLFFWNGSAWDNIVVDGDFQFLQLFGDYLLSTGKNSWSVLDMSTRLVIANSTSETINTPIIWNNQVWSVTYDKGEIAYPDSFSIIDLDTYPNRTLKAFPKEITSLLPDLCVFKMIATNHQLSFVTCLFTWEQWNGTNWVTMFEGNLEVFSAVAWNLTHLVVVTDDIGIYIGSDLIQSIDLKINILLLMPAALFNNRLFIMNSTSELAGCTLLMIELDSELVTPIMAIPDCFTLESLFVDGDNLYIGVEQQLVFIGGNTTFTNIIKYSISEK